MSFDSEMEDDVPLRPAFTGELADFVDEIIRSGATGATGAMSSSEDLTPATGNTFDGMSDAPQPQFDNDDDIANFHLIVRNSVDALPRGQNSGGQPVNPEKLAKWKRATSAASVSNLDLFRSFEARLDGRDYEGMLRDLTEKIAETKATWMLRDRGGLVSESQKKLLDRHEILVQYCGTLQLSMAQKLKPLNEAVSKMITEKGVYPKILPPIVDSLKETIARIEASISEVDDNHQKMDNFTKPKLSQSKKDACMAFNTESVTFKLSTEDVDEVIATEQAAHDVDPDETEEEDSFDFNPYEFGYQQDNQADEGGLEAFQEDAAHGVPDDEQDPEIPAVAVVGPEDDQFRLSKIMFYSALSFGFHACMAGLVAVKMNGLDGATCVQVFGSLAILITLWQVSHYLDGVSARGRAYQPVAQLVSTVTLLIISVFGSILYHPLVFLVPILFGYCWVAAAPAGVYDEALDLGTVSAELRQVIRGDDFDAVYISKVVILLGMVCFVRPLGDSEVATVMSTYMDYLTFAVFSFLVWMQWSVICAIFRGLRRVQRDGFAGSLARTLRFAGDVSAGVANENQDMTAMDYDEVDTSLMLLEWTGNFMLGLWKVFLIFSGLLILNHVLFPRVYRSLLAFNGTNAYQYIFWVISSAVLAMTMGAVANDFLGNGEADVYPVNAEDNHNNQLVDLLVIPDDVMLQLNAL